LSWIDRGILLAYLAGTLYLGLRRPRLSKDDASAYLLAGRGLTLPAFVATTVSSWYGGILGVGEYSYRYGLSNWLVFGVPYYVGAGLFALLLSRRARRAATLTLPERLEQCYGRAAGKLSAGVIVVTTLPAAYLLTLGVLTRTAFGLPLWLAVGAATLFSVVYVWRGGFASVVRTDVLQVLLMFGGFGLLLALLLGRHGLEPLSALPETHYSWHGGIGVAGILVWYVIALGTLAEPAFFQRCLAAKTPQVARRGLFLSIGLWMLFDAMTTTCGLYARALLPELGAGQAAEAFPRLALAVLPVGVLGLFFTGLFATVMSTVDSYLFIVASTVAKDLRAQGDEASLRRATRGSLVVAGAAAAGLALLSGSVVELWKAFGSLGAGSLIVPVMGAYFPRLRLRPRAALLAMGGSALLILLWIAGRRLELAPFTWVEAIYVGLGWSLLVLLLDRFAPQPSSGSGATT
jgi:SSS family solute:Na+ symporter